MPRNLDAADESEEEEEDDGIEVVSATDEPGRRAHYVAAVTQRLKAASPRPPSFTLHRADPKAAPVRELEQVFVEEATAYLSSQFPGCTVTMVDHETDEETALQPPDDELNCGRYNAVLYWGRLRGMPIAQAAADYQMRR
jgi:hypothetical protein